MIGIWYKVYQIVYYMYYDRKVWMVSALNQGPVWQSVIYLLLNSQASLDLVNNTIKKYCSPVYKYYEPLWAYKKNPSAYKIIIVL